MEENYKQFQEIVDRLIVYLRFRDNERKQGEDELWNKIEQEIDSRKRFSVKRPFYWGAVAAILILLLFSVVYFHSDGSDSLDKYVAQLDEPIIESSQIQVYLSPDEKVAVEEKTASVSYSSKGKVSINQEEQVSALDQKVEQEFNQILVPKGKYTCLTLSDGSTVHINSGTRVVYPRVFSSERREIYVEGEVCLHVTRNEQAPFIVKTSTFEVEVLGTTFNVNAYKNDPNAEVVLVNGSIRLSDQNKNRVEMKPDQLATINQGKINAMETVNASDYVAWTEGLLVLHLEPLESLFKKLEQFYGVSLQVAPEAGALRMRGKVDLKQSLDDLLTLISSTAPIQFEKREGIYYIRKK